MRACVMNLSRAVLIFAFAVNVRINSQPAVSPTAIVLTNVAIIDGTSALAQPNMTVALSGEKISALGKDGGVTFPRNAQVIDGTGKFLLAGLWDMHVHLSYTKASALPALVANGVTGVRDLGGMLIEVDEWRVKIESGVLIGPRIVRAGPVL